MSPVAIKPVSINSGQQSFRALSMPKWAPLGQQALFNKKRMGQKRLGQSATDDVAKNIGMGVISAAGVYIGSKLLPSAWGVLAIGAGLIGIMYSLNNLVGGEKADGAPPNGKALPSEEGFKGVSGAFLTPRQYERVDVLGPDWAPLTSSFLDIDVSFKAVNNSDKPVNVTLRFSQTETANRWYGPDSTNTATYLEEVSVPARGFKIVNFQIDTLNWTGSLVEKLIAEKIDKDGKASKLAEITFYIGT